MGNGETSRARAQDSVDPEAPIERPDPPPADGELGYTSALEGGRTGLEEVLSYEPVPGQLSVDELLEAQAEEEPRSLTRLQQLREDRRK